MAKRILPFILLFSIALFGNQSFGQTVAMDFNQNDCAGVNHHLFTDLDNGKVAVITYIELGCSSCIVATSGIKTLLPAFEVSDQGRVELFSFGYSDSYSCAEMTAWKNQNGYTHPVFSGGGAQTNYYGGMGMPTIVVVGGPEHTITYKQLGYATSDKPLISDAITAALALSAGIPENLQEKGVHVYPTLFDSHITIGFDKPFTADIAIYDMMGKLVLSQEKLNSATVSLNTTTLTKGVYAMKISSQGVCIGTIRIVKQ